MIRALSPPLFRSWRLPFSRAKLAYISLNTQTPCPPRGACPCGTNLIKNPVWMRHARDDVSARVAVFPPESNPAFSNPAGLPALLRRGTSGRLAYFQNGSLKLVVIPEPGVALLGGLGLLALLRRRRS